MTALRIGSLFSGYGGLDQAVQAVLGGTTAWVSDIDKGACKILAHRYPDAPNIGDITQVDWADVEPVDVLCGGFPCQDVSAAGKRAGIRPGTRSGLWSQFAYAISQLRPSLVVIENVRGLLSASAHSNLEPCPWCVGEGPGVHLRALGAVLGDLADLGFDAEWVGLPASRVGAPHGRWREFVAAWPADSEGFPWRILNGDGPAAADHDGAGRSSVGRVDPVGRNADRRGREDGLRPLGQQQTLLPSPRTSDTNGAGRHGDGGLDLRTAVSLLPTPMARDHKGYGPADGKRNDPNLSAVPLLLPTPAVNDMGAAYTPETWDAWTASMQAKHGNGNGHGKSLEIEAQRLLPTPAVGDVLGGRKHRSGDRSDELLLNGIAHEERWGDYAAAVARWESVTRPAPAPTEPTSKGTQRLSPRFSEWMMGVPDGWITDVPSITRNEALKACGNGVVPQQAEAALRWLLPLMAEAVAA